MPDSFILKTFKGLSALASVAPTLLIFGFFNSIFVGGFLRTAYNFAKYFIPYIIVTFLIIGIAETLHHVPALSALNAFGFDHMVLQIILFYQELYSTYY